MPLYSIAYECKSFFMGTTCHSAFIAANPQYTLGSGCSIDWQRDSGIFMHFFVFHVFKGKGPYRRCFYVF